MSKGKRVLNCIGLMSGTSMDGVDAALLTVDYEEDCIFLNRLGAHHEIAFDATLKSNIMQILGRTKPDEATKAVEDRLTDYYCLAVNELLEKARLSPSDIDFIGLHGQTITHQPENAFTWQLGDGTALAARTAIDVVYDFRQQDIQNGGQGAPLAPIFHQALAKADYLPDLPVILLNIGGVSNITLLSQNEIRAYDTGPGNGSMDDYCQEFLQLDYDPDGRYALQGVADQAIIQQFMEHAFFALPAPKSLDRRDFNHHAVKHLAPNDALSTLTACTATAIAKAIKDEIRNHAPNLKNIILAGGGAHNQALCRALQLALPNCHFLTLQEIDPSLNGDALEAWAFAWLAALHFADLPASFPKTTGVHSPQKAGTLAQATAS